jgi:osmotically-inducible protein OsmY
MSTHRLVITAALLATSLAFGCGGTEPRSGHRARRSTSGGERRGDVHSRNQPHASSHESATLVEADETSPSAMDQSESAEDVEITRQIRVAVVGDSSLSFGARNCTIVTVGAVVTLRGEVGTDDERNAIDRHAHDVTGVRRVDNMLVVTE